MPTIIHVCVDIRGALRNWTDRQWRGVVTDDAGHVLTPAEAKEFFMDELAKGRKVIPACECEGFDYQKGCPGHHYEDDAASRAGETKEQG